MQLNSCLSIVYLRYEFSQDDLGISSFRQLAIMEEHFLHGRLKVHVIRAADLPDTDTFFWNLSSDDFTGIKTLCNQVSVSSLTRLKGLWFDSFTWQIFLL